jgi:hypothetical protein
MPNKVQTNQKNTQTGLKRVSNFSKGHLLIVVLVFAAVGGYILWTTFAAGTPIAAVEAERMSLPAGASVINDTSASGGQAVQMTADGNATSLISLPSPGTSFTIMARAQQCSGSPSVSVSVDGKSLLSTAVSSSSWTSYTASTTLSSGSHDLTVNGFNLAAKQHGGKGGGGGHGNKKQSCTRTLYLDVTNFYGDTTPPPAPPTVSLSASPTTVSSGQSSTLTWSSTNATGCNASGAWSGSKATSGSASTGALNQTSTYTMTCTNGTASATASASVTVSAPTVPPAPTIYFNPPTQGYTVGSNITIEVRENSGSTGVNAVQANFSYPSDKLTFVSADGSASGFTTQAQSVGGNGTVTLARGIIGSLSGDQLVAKVTFKVNIAGTANLSFVNGSALINATTNQNVISSLSADGTGVYTLQ